jgi:hypothetical protein
MSIGKSLCGMVLLGALPQLAVAQTAAPADPSPTPLAFARVTSAQPKLHFISDATRPGCPSLAPDCQMKAYLVPGDVVSLAYPLDSAGGRDSQFILATYVGAHADTFGDLPASGLEPFTPVATAADFVGDWQADGNELVITLANGALSLNGAAQVSTDNVTGALSLANGQARFDDGTCQLLMARLGRELIVSENGQCYDNDSALSGNYTRTGK